MFVPVGHRALIGGLAQSWKGCGIALTDPVLAFSRHLGHSLYFCGIDLLKARMQLSQTGSWL
ncbi:MAG: hypothetical protein OSA82_14875 [Paracoccaceae bacterium]|nr:hypothetical protein [Paracoccaceae bacterium]